MAGDVVLQVTAGDEVIARMGIYWHTIAVGDAPLDVAWVDHLFVEETYRRMGFGKALFGLATIVAGREREWGVGVSPESGWFEEFGWFRPDDGDWIVGALSGAPQVWPPGVIEAGPPWAE